MRFHRCWSRFRIESIALRSFLAIFLAIIEEQPPFCWPFRSIHTRYQTCRCTYSFSSPLTRKFEFFSSSPTREFELVSFSGWFTRRRGCFTARDRVHSENMRCWGCEMIRWNLNSQWNISCSVLPTEDQMIAAPRRGRETHRSREQAIYFRNITTRIRDTGSLLNLQEMDGWIYPGFLSTFRWRSLWSVRDVMRILLVLFSSFCYVSVLSSSFRMIVNLCVEEVIGRNLILL